ncbi:MAG: hypothetical protein J6Y55_08230 [Bacteroidales bacterium]|nr:hypothetical protein [Bacteroidales bacterium]
MKKLTLFLATILCACLAIAQVPQTMNFQALIRNAENEVVTNQQVDVEVRVLNASQTAVYVETHSVTTSSGGVATMEIGAGTPVSGSFAAIDWAAGRYYLETRIQLPDGSDALTDVSPLLSVPYSLYAAKAGEVDIDLSEYAKKSDIPEAVDLSDYALKSEIPSEVSLEEYAKKSEIPAMPDLSGYALKSEIPAEVDLTDYAKKSDIPEAVDLSGYALKSELPAEVDLTDYAKKSDIPEAVDLSGYALKSELPAEVDLTDYALKSDIPEAVDLSGYALKSEIPAEVDLTDYAKKSDIPEAVDLSGYALKSEIPAEVDLTGYALKSELPTVPDVTGYATKTEVSENYLTKETFENYVLGAGQPESVDLSVYAKTADVNAALATLESQIPEEVDLTDYAKSADIESAYAKKTDLNGYALVSQIPDEVDLTDYAKSADIESAYAKKSDLNGYALVSQIPDEVDLTDYAKSADIESAYAKKTDLNSYALVSQIPAEVDLTDYAKSTDIESAYAKKTDLNGYALVSQIPDEVDLTDYAKSADIESAYAKKTDLNGYALVSQLPDEVDLTDYAKSADIESAYAKKTALNEYTKSGANISVFVNDVEYVKKSYVDSLFNVLKAQIAAIPNGGGNGGNGGETGKIDAKFSVSATKQVYFSKGNLQYQASTNTWRFAENQYDIVGSDNANISSSNTGWIDLFGWATSGYNGMNPYMTSSTPSDYGDGSSDIAGTNYDWGVNNAISNGGNEAGLWRTLTIEEWKYLMESRPNASSLVATASIDGVITGVILLPDDSTIPVELSFTAGIYSLDAAMVSNKFTSTQWKEYEKKGAIFLPVSGQRVGTTYSEGNGYNASCGEYWSSTINTEADDKSAFRLEFANYFSSTANSTECNYGYAVRLVQDAE